MSSHRNPAAAASPRLRRRLYLHLDPAAWPGQGLSPANRLVAVAIVLSVAAAIIETEPTIGAEADHIFRLVETGFGGLFLLEYVARVWTSAEDPHYGPGLGGRLRYMLSPLALLDLLALLPLVLPMVGTSAFLLRMARMLRILRLARLGRFSSAMTALGTAVHSRRYELFASVCAALMILLISSTLLYVVEGPVQPEYFGSIPRAMWWSTETLTTVGYGDIVPVTPLGRALSALTAIAGIGLIAMPTGILAAAFSDVMAKRRAESGED
jgi:voltage-gated potassium channel